MIARLIIFMLGYLLAFGVPATAIGYAVRRMIGPAMKRRRARKLAEHHAKLLTAHMKDDEEQQCFHCLQLCTEADCYEKGKGWYHEKCMKALLNS